MKKKSSQFRYSASATLVLLGTLAMTAQGLKDQACAYKKFPIFSGGFKKEHVNTMTVDPITNNIFVGGLTDSSNYAPAENPHGYIYTVSPDGDWLWGEFFYNVSYAVSSIDGIVMSQNNNFITCLGQANNKPVIMNLNKQKGQIQKFYTVDPIDINQKVSYLTSQAIYMEEKAPEDNATYFYLSFLQRINTVRRMHILKFSASDLKIQWHVSRTGHGGNAVFNADLDDRSTFMVFDTNIRREFYLFGRLNYQDTSSLNDDRQSLAIRINKLDGKFLHFLKFPNQQEALAIVHPINTNLFLGCGNSTMTYTPHGVTYFKITNDGQQIFYRKFKMANSECRGLTYDYEKAQGTLLITSLDDSIRVVNRYGKTIADRQSQDVFLMVVSDSGQLIRAHQISFNPSDKGFLADMSLGINSLRRIGNHYIFAGHTNGYGTIYQEVEFAGSEPNSFVMKFAFDKSTNHQCLFEGSVRSLQDITMYDISPGISRDDAELSYRTSEIVSYSNYFKMYSSPYSGAFELLDTMHIPRPCASAYANLTQMDYYYGQHKKKYNFRNEPSYKQRAVNVYAQMDAEKEFVFQNGSSAERFAWLDNGTDLNNQTTVWVQTNNENLVGTQRTVIRGCDNMGKLLEINFYVNVTSNSAPEFTEDIQTQWNLNVGDTINYKLPPIRDPEGNDVGEVYINTMENQEFPPFINFTEMNTTKPALKLTPNNLRYQGRTYYFSVVLKEKHSNTMMNVYYMTVKILGDPVDEKDLRPPNKTLVNITLVSLNYKSQGQLKFSMDINTGLFSKENKTRFNELFYVYVKTIEKKTEAIRGIDFNVIDNKTVNFTVQFQNPYMYGLLNKKSDMLIFKCKNCSDEELISYLVLNATNQTIRVINQENTTCQLKIGMQFDFRDEKMSFYRSLAVALYYVMIAIIVIQFFVLMLRKVTFLPLWTLIEYMQLIAFMPLYNFKLIPYLYDAFKPMLVGHIILFNDSLMYKDLSDDYFNINYEYYWLPISKLIQSLMNILILFVIMVVANIVLFVLSYTCKTGRIGEFVKHRLSQFKFNAYIRFYMLAYFDFTFFSIMKILDGNNSTTTRKIATFFSYAFFVTSIIVPLFFLALLLRRFTVLEEKSGRERFNTLIAKIDKGSKWRVFQPILFFIRRAATAGLLCLPINNQFIFLQYIFILVTSHVYILYLVASKPYQTPVFNAYMLANETFYSALIILIFIFSDATPQLNIKVIAGAALVASIFLLVLANIVFIGYIVWKGRENLKTSVKDAKIKRLEEEEKERQEELERLEKKRKEEEEFSKVPDDTTNNMTMVDQTNKTTEMNANTTMAALGDKGKAKAAFAKQKANVDDVVNGPYTTAKKGTTATDAGTEEKFMKKSAGAKGAKGKVSGEEKSSGDSDPQKPRGPIMQ